MKILCHFFILLIFSLFTHSEVILNDDYEQLTINQISSLKRTNFFKRILQQSEMFLDQKTDSIQDLGRLVSVREKITGIVTSFKLRFLGNHGFYEIEVQAVESQNIINFTKLTLLQDEHL